MKQDIGSTFLSVCLDKKMKWDETFMEKENRIEENHDAKQNHKNSFNNSICYFYSVSGSLYKP